MLAHPTYEALSALKLNGMAEAFAELIASDNNLDPAAWIAFMTDREQARRGTRRFQARLRAAKLRHGEACMEDVNYRATRGLDSVSRDTQIYELTRHPVLRGRSKRKLPPAGALTLRSQSAPAKGSGMPGVVVSF